MNWENWEAHPHDYDFIQKILDKVPRSFWKHIQEKYNHIKISENRQASNLYLVDLEEKFKSMKLRLDSDDQDIRDLAKKEAATCKRITANSKNNKRAISKLANYSKHYGILEPKANTEMGIIKRYGCERWWRRKLRQMHGQKVEEIALHLNIVNKNKEIYASNAAVTRRRGQKTRNRNILEEIEAVNELGDSFTLQELSDKSVSNPKLQRAELMTRIAGFEIVSKELGHVGEFYTLTCPSRMHSSLHYRGQANSKYDGTTPKQAQVYLVKMWSHIRTALANKGIPICGIRVTEPHHDGTPHWHLMLFMKPEHQKIVREIFQKHALKIDGDEKGAQEYRFKAIVIDPNKGTAAGYIAKYISKNIDGHGIESDTYGHNAITSAERIDTYVSTWGLRQFQFFGSPPVTIWRELRKSTIESKDKNIQKAFEAANAGNWAEFLKIMGGPLVGKNDRPIQLLMAWSDKPGRYDEPVGQTIIGIESDKDSVITRVHIWTISQKSEKSCSNSENFRNPQPDISENPGNTLADSSENFGKSRADISENSENLRPGDSESFRNLLSEFSEYSEYFSE